MALSPVGNTFTTPLYALCCDAEPPNGLHDLPLVLSVKSFLFAIKQVLTWEE